MNRHMIGLETPRQLPGNSAIQSTSEPGNCRVCGRKRNCRGQRRWLHPRRRPRPEARRVPACCRSCSRPSVPTPPCAEIKCGPDEGTPRRFHTQMAQMNDEEEHGCDRGENFVRKARSCGIVIRSPGFEIYLAQSMSVGAGDPARWTAAGTMQMNSSGALPVLRNWWGSLAQT